MILIETDQNDVCDDVLAHVATSKQYYSILHDDGDAAGDSFPTNLKEQYLAILLEWDWASNR